ncbi:hypothetical protein DRO37_00905 [Candidatus Bathyarchaeota archaeon]|nr:MAG: hypothetical protein DRO37_00905 [Candidatus Bathyarchaeota archaeon]
MHSKYSRLLLLLIPLVLIVPANPYISAASPAHKIYIGSKTLKVGSEATMEIRILGAEDVAGALIEVTYNSSILKVVSVEQGDFQVFGSNHSRPGSLRIVGASAEALGKSEALMAKVTFRGISSGASALKIVRAELCYENGTFIRDIEFKDGAVKVLDYIWIVDIEPKSGTELITEKTYTFKLTVNYSFTSADYGYIGLVAKINDLKNPSIAHKKIPIYGYKIADVKDLTLNVDIPSDAEKLYVAVRLLKGNETSTEIYDVVEYQVKKSGCLIATATFGSELSPEVNFLRSFRDQEVLSTYAGRCFMEVFNNFYYSWSPNVAVFIRKNAIVKTAFKILLYPLIMILHLSSFTYRCLSQFPEAAILAAGYVASSLIGSVYLGLPLSQIKRFRRMECRILKAWIYSVLLILIPIVQAEAMHSVQLMMATTAIFVLLNIGFSSILTGTLIAKGVSILPQIIKKKWTRSYL